MKWWDTDFRFRRKMIISAGPSKIIPNPFVGKIPVDISTIGSLLVSRNDVRIVKWDGVNWTELDRIYYDDNNILFPINDEIGVNSYNDRYYIYYDNPDAGTPPSAKVNVLLPRRDGQTNSLYYLDGDAQDWGEGILTPETDLANGGGVTFPDFGFYKAARGIGSNPSFLYQPTSPSQQAWGSDTHPLRNFEFWMHPVGVSNQGQILAYWRAGGPGSWQKIRVVMAGSTMFVEYQRVDADGSIVSVNCPGIIIGDELHHYAAAWFQGAFSGVGGLQFYRDGVPYAMFPAPAYPDGEAENTYPSLFAYFNGTAMEAFLNAYLFGVRFGRNNGDEMNSLYGNKPFNWGKRNILPFITITSPEVVSSHMGAV